MGFFPQNINFFKLFEEQAKQLAEANKLLQQIAGSDDCRAQVTALQDVEHKADHVAHQIFNHLNQTFITPIEREDIFALTGRLDDVVDEIEAVVNKMDLYKVAPNQKQIVQCIKIIDKATKTVNKAIFSLPQLHKSSHEIMKHCEVINFIENQVDEMTRQFIGDLVNDGQDVIGIIKLKEIFELFEAIADRCEDVAHTLETIVVKNQ